MLPPVRLLAESYEKITTTIVGLFFGSNWRFSVHEPEIPVPFLEIFLGKGETMFLSND